MTFYALVLLMTLMSCLRTKLKYVCFLLPPHSGANLLLFTVDTDRRTLTGFYFSDAEEELNKLAELAERINSQISTEESSAFTSSQNVDLDQLFNFLSQVRMQILEKNCIICYSTVQQ